MVLETLTKFIKKQHPKCRLVVGYSGGVDSTVLLHALAHLKFRLVLPELAHITIEAWHVNHQLSPRAGEWADHCKLSCSSLGVEFAEIVVDVDGSEASLEQEARKARYQAFSEALKRNDVLLTAHHQDDQCETVFLRLARGAGLLGLGAMQPLRTLGPALLARPLLGVAKSEVMAYAQSFHLTWVDDDSNDSIRFDRNFLRREVLPKLALRWPSFAQNTARAASHLHDSHALLTQYLESDVALLLPRKERVGHSVVLPQLMAWQETRQLQVLMCWLLSLGARSPSEAQWTQILSMLYAKPDRSPVVVAGEGEWRRYRDRLYYLPKEWRVSVEAQYEPMSRAMPLALAIEGNMLQLDDSMRGAGLNPCLEYTCILRGHTMAPQRAHPQSRDRSQSFKKLLQEYRLEPWLRDFVVLVLHRGELAAVAGLWVEKAFCDFGSEAIRLHWMH